MKTLILWMLVLIVASVTNAQNVNIPDTAFLNALIDDGVDTNGDSLISTAEAEAVTYINNDCYCVNPVWCSGNPISDLTGLEAFINLDTLLIYGNNVDSIDLSLNIKLLYLKCGGNQLTNLDVSKNVALEMLSCGGNQLTSLDVSSCTALTGLECWDNQLISVNVCGCSNLEYLDCHGNQLSSLDVSKNVALEMLSCKRNQLTSLDVSGCTALTGLECCDNQLISLNISGCRNLEYLDCDGNQLSSLDVSTNVALEILSCGGNQLTSLDVSSCTALTDLRPWGMPTLYEVCIWESFPAGVEVATFGSPNVQFTTDCATNIKNDYNENRTVDIYPNPSDDIINIEIENINNAAIEIYNVSGRLVLSKELNSKVEKIDVSGLLEGIYFVKVRQAGGVHVRKVVVK